MEFLGGFEAQPVLRKRHADRTPSPPDRSYEASRRHEREWENRDERGVTQTEKLPPDSPICATPRPQAREEGLSSHEQWACHVCVPDIPPDGGRGGPAPAGISTSSVRRSDSLASLERDRSWEPGRRVRLGAILRLEVRPHPGLSLQDPSKVGPPLDCATCSASTAVVGSHSHDSERGASVARRPGRGGLGEWRTATECTSFTGSRT